MRDLEEQRLARGQEGSGIAMDVFNAIKTYAPQIQSLYTSDLGNSVRNMLPDSDENARPGFPGEMHVPLALPNGKTGQANFMGPGTKVLQRIERGDPPRTEVDKISRAHDLRYTLAQSMEDIREADNKMIRKVDETQAQGKDSTQNIVLANAIRAKAFAEDIGALDKEAFARNTSRTYEERGYSDSQVSTLKNELASMEQEGYGKLRPGDRLKLKVIKEQQRKARKKLNQVLGTKQFDGTPEEQALAAVLELSNKAGKKYRSAQLTDPENTELTSYEILRHLKSL